MAITAISKAAPQVTNFGPVGGSYAKNITAISMGQNANQSSGSIGPQAAIAFDTVASISASQTNVEQSRIQLNSDARLLSVEISFEAATGTASVDIIDITNGNAAVIGATTIPAGGAGTVEVTTFSSNAERLLAKGTVLALRANTAAASSITLLGVNLIVQALSAPAGQRSYD